MTRRRLNSLLPARATRRGGSAAGGRRAGVHAGGVRLRRRRGHHGGGSGGGDGPPRLAEIVLPQTRLLSPIRNRCFQTTKDYWTYELCPMRSVRQFRLEGARVASEFSLGKYEKQQDKLTVGVRGKLPKGSCRTSSRSAPPSRPSLLRSLLRSFAPSLAPSLPLHLRPRPALATRPRPSLLGRGRTSLSARCPRTRRTYLNGTSNRKADVRVRCARKNEHTLLSVDEPQVHSYVLVFSTPLACELNCVLSYAPRP